MSDVTWVEVVLGRLAIPVALVINPLLLARCTVFSSDRSRLFLVAALWALVLQPIAALLLHFTGIPIASVPLVVFHGVVAGISVGLLVAMRRRIVPALGAWPRDQLWVCAVLAVLIFPFTHLAGVDPYKWADLATAVAVDRRITWLVHPLSLIGYTARSYPSLHPLLMGSIRALGVTSVEAAFFLTSLVTCAVGVTSSAYLATRLGLARRDIGLYAAFYALSPAFIRYVHWGTGRGAFLAVLPLFVAALLDMPRLRAWGLALLSGLLLVLSHKTGLIAVCVLPLLRLGGVLYPRRHPRICASLLLLTFVVSIAFAPPRYFGGPLGMVAGWVRYDLARFGWVSPALLLAAVITPRTVFRSSGSGFMWLSLVVVFPAAHHMEMYPALIVLPFMTYVGLAAFRALQTRLPGTEELHLRVVLALTLCGALAIVLQRSIESMPHRVYLAAKHIEEVDPYGPFEIASPWRSYVQGMVSGAPRFTVEAGKDNKISLDAPPPFTLHPRQFVYTWVPYLRSMIQTSVKAEWYGKPHARYYVLPDSAQPPQQGVLIYDHKEVRIYRQALPSVP